MLALSKFRGFALSLFIFVALHLHGCGGEETDEKGQFLQQTAYVGPKLSMPLPAGILWKVNTNPGFWSAEVTYHSGIYYHAIDFGDNFYVSGQLFDMGSGVIDVLAADDGTVSEVVEKPNCGDGSSNRACKVFVNHSGAKHASGYETEYTHLAPATIVVAIGQHVRRGQKLGKMGWSGTKSPHLHFSLRYNNDSSKNNPALVGAKIENVPFINYALDQRYPSTNGFSYTPANNPVLCATEPTGSAATNWVYTCTPKTGVINLKEPVWGLIGIENIAHDFGWKAEVWHKDEEAPKAFQLVTTYQWDATGVDPWGWNHSYYWPWIFPDKPGAWEMRYYVKTNDVFPDFPMAVLPFTVANTPPYAYDGNGMTCAKPAVGTAATNWVYSCAPVSSFSFFLNPTVYGLLHVENIFKNFKFVTKMYYNGQYLYTDDPGYFTVVEPWKWEHAYAFPQVQRPQPGNWRMEVSLTFSDGTPSVKLRDINFTVAP